MKCPKCGFAPTIGRPKKIDDDAVMKMRKKKMSLAQIADQLGVTRGAVQAAIKRKGEVMAKKAAKKKAKKKTAKK